MAPFLKLFSFSINPNLETKLPELKWHFWFLNFLSIFQPRSQSPFLRPFAAVEIFLQHHFMTSKKCCWTFAKGDLWLFSPLPHPVGDFFRLHSSETAVAIYINEKNTRFADCFIHMLLSFPSHSPWRIFPSCGTGSLTGCEMENMKSHFSRECCFRNFIRTSQAKTLEITKVGC